MVKKTKHPNEQTFKNRKTVANKAGDSSDPSSIIHQLLVSCLGMWQRLLLSPSVLLSLSPPFHLLYRVTLSSFTLLSSSPPLPPSSPLASFFSLLSCSSSSYLCISLSNPDVKQPYFKSSLATLLSVKLCAWSDSFC